MLTLPASAVSQPVAAAPACSARIMPLGDSLTFGLLENPRSEDSYRGHLYRSLVQAGYGVDMVGPNNGPLGLGGDPDHAGFGGYTIGPDKAVDYLGKPANLFEIVGAWLPAANPDIIILNIGANDLAAGDRTVDDPEKEAADPNGVVAANLAPLRLRGLVAQLGLLAPRATILVTDSPPSGSSEEIDIGPRKSALRDMARAVGDASATDRVEFIPVYQRLLDAGFTRASDLADGTHMTLAGGQKFAAAVRPEVVAALQRFCATKPPTGAPATTTPRKSAVTTKRTATTRRRITTRARTP